MQQHELFEIIENYIAGQLSGDALSDFENQLKNDPGLQAEVALHRKLQIELGNVQKNKLRSELTKLRTEFSNKKQGSPTPVRSINWRRTLSIAATFLLLGTALWYFLFKAAPDTEHFAEQPVIKPTPEDTILAPQPIETPEERVVEQPEEETPTIRQEPIPQEEIVEAPVPPTPAPEPQYNFDPNPAFEQMIAANSAQRIYEFNVEVPGTEQVLTRINGSTDFLCAGVLIAPEVGSSERFSLNVFNTGSSSAEAGNAVATLSIVLEEQTEEEEEGLAFAKKLAYFFNARGRLELDPGLYYYVISKLDTEGQSNLYTGKFNVN